MTGSVDHPKETIQLGDYRVGRMVSSGSRSQTFEAEQISVRRQVLLERVRPEAEGDQHATDAFLADVRAKAAVDHPVVGSVYEAVQQKGAVYYTRELLRGRTLETLRAAEEELEPRQAAVLLKQIGEAIHYLRKIQVARLPLAPHHLVLGDHDVLRMVNLAVAGVMDGAVETHDRQVVAEVLLDLLAVERPGSTRMRKLLTLMAGKEPPTWGQIGHTAKKLAHELSEAAKSITQPVTIHVEPDGEEGKGPGVLAPILVGLLGLGLLGLGAAFLMKHQRTPKVRTLDAMVRVTGALAAGPGGEKTLLPAYWIDAHEVTIAEYAEFLRALDLLREDQRGVYDHRDQPPEKTGHEPGDWPALHEAAKRGLKWNDQPVTVNFPVVNVDWWDAFAYANWRGGRLPSFAEWLAAADGTAPKVSGWGEVDASESDKTPTGIHGLAGNVSEWVLDPGVNPAFPMNPKAPMACGASYLNPRSGNLARTWFESRTVRRPDLGFRMVRTTQAIN